MASCKVQAPVNDNVFSANRLPNPRSNQGNPIDATSTAWMQSVTTDTPKADMRTRYNRDGYLWVRNLIPREDVLDMREQLSRTQHLRSPLASQQLTSKTQPQLFPTVRVNRDTPPIHIPPRRHLQLRQRPPRAPRYRRYTRAKDPRTARQSPRNAHLPPLSHPPRSPRLRPRLHVLEQGSIGRPRHAAPQLPREPEHRRPL